MNFKQNILETLVPGDLIAISCSYSGRLFPGIYIGHKVRELKYTYTTSLNYTLHYNLVTVNSNNPNILPVSYIKWQEWGISSIRVIPISQDTLDSRDRAKYQKILKQFFPEYEKQKNYTRDNTVEHNSR